MDCLEPASPQRCRGVESCWTSSPKFSRAHLRMCSSGLRSIGKTLCSSFAKCDSQYFLTLDLSRRKPNFRSSSSA